MEENYICTDDKIMIKLDWISNFRKVNDCYKIKINFDKYFEFEVCKNNPSYPKLDNHFKFSKK